MLTGDIKKPDERIGLLAMEIGDLTSSTTYFNLQRCQTFDDIKNYILFHQEDKECCLAGIKAAMQVVKNSVKQKKAP